MAAHDTTVDTGGLYPESHAVVYRPHGEAQEDRGTAARPEGRPWTDLRRDPLHNLGAAGGRRHSAAKAVNSLMTATYWEIGRRIVVSEQAGKARAEYGEGLIARLAEDLAARHGRGFSARNLRQMRAFYLGWEIWQTPSAKSLARAKGFTPAIDLADKGRPSVAATLIPKPTLATLAEAFRLPWSHYVRLLAFNDSKAREFYEAEALRGGWSIRQLNRQIDSQFYERTLLSRNKAAMLTKGQKPRPEDAVTPREEIKDPFVLEFLDLKDEYSELELEEALIRHMEGFLLELGNDFAFVGRRSASASATSRAVGLLLTSVALAN